MVKTKEIVQKFLVAYTDNNLASIPDILADDIEINYSNISSAKGKNNVTDVLKWDYNFDVTRVTTTNVLSYTKDHYEYIGLIAHHLVSFEKNNEMFPLVFGGKYVFKVNLHTNVIDKIAFVLEYQSENTIYVKGKWKLSTGQNDYSLLSEFDTITVLQNAMKEKDLHSIVNLFFWCLDTGDFDILDKLCSEKFTVSRDKSVGHDRFTSDKKSLNKFMENTNQYYALNQNSIRINKINYGDFISVTAQRLTPHRLGTKKLNSTTKYHSFFDEDISLIINSQSLKLESADMKKAADVYYNGIKLLEY